MINIMFSWEYPPNCIGGLGTHVTALTAEYELLGIKTHLITLGKDDDQEYEEQGNLHIYRVKHVGFHCLNFINYVQHMNFLFLEKALEISKKHAINIIHAHDWLVSYAALALKKINSLPLITTIHATEMGRNRGLYSDEQKYIHSIENQLAHNSDAIIVCSNYMKREIRDLFGLKESNIEVIYNGINESKSEAPRSKNMTFLGKNIITIGRLVHEKGIQALIKALPKVISFDPEIKLIIIGKGPLENELRNLVKKLGLSSSVIFTGFIDEETKQAIFEQSLLAVIPSLYEPFGIVALETMAAGIPTIVSDTGGLGEIVEHKVNGLKAYPNNPDSIADNILCLLKEKNLRDNIIQNAISIIKDKYSWLDIARRTSALYQKHSK